MSRQNSQVAWLPNTNKLVQAVARKAHALFLGQRQAFHATRGVEPLQVVRYDDGGEYVLHQDANRRLLTVLYYLNGAGESWFRMPRPCMKLLRGRDYRPWSSVKGCNPAATASWCPASERKITPRAAIVQQGDAVAFWSALHAGLPVSSTKWIGNHFYHHVPIPPAHNIDSEELQ
jgi:hypothetical protein